MKFAFIYKVNKPLSKSEKFFVVISKSHVYNYFDLHRTSVGLQPTHNYPVPLTEYTYTPDLLIQESIQEFDTEQEAYGFMINFYSEQKALQDKVEEEKKEKEKEKEKKEQAEKFEVVFESPDTI